MQHIHTHLHALQWSDIVGVLEEPIPLEARIAVFVAPLLKLNVFCEQPVSVSSMCKQAWARKGYANVLKAGSWWRRLTALPVDVSPYP
eukprot:1162077-Pelagomonas_calceolata.AAC.9